jgi:hypothetical protein
MAFSGFRSFRCEVPQCQVLSPDRHDLEFVGDGSERCVEVERVRCRMAVAVDRQ